MSRDARSPAAGADIAASDATTPRHGWGLDVFRHRSLAAGLLIAGIIVLLVAAAPLLTSADPTLQDPTQSFAPPSAEHPMGADAFGRDMLARVLYGGRTTMLASLCAVALGGIAGVALGLVAGYAGGVVRFAIMRLVDLMLAFPGILLALSVSAVLGPGLANGVLAIAVVLTPIFARLVEGATAEVRHLPYVDAAVTLGAGAPRVILRHILPNVSPGIIVLTTTWLGIAVLYIAALGFIGVGVQPPLPEWGEILNDGQNYITLAWWITVFPGVFLALLVIGVNLIGDGLRDQLDPTLSRL